jgi:hypothetical protein
MPISVTKEKLEDPTPQLIHVRFDPKEDITAYEVARLILVANQEQMPLSRWEQLGELQRHFKRL